MLRPISPELVLSQEFWISNIPRYFSFALSYIEENTRFAFKITRITKIRFASFHLRIILIHLQIWEMFVRISTVFFREKGIEVNIFLH